MPTKHSDDYFSILPHIGRYLNHYEATGQHASVADVIARISRFNLFAVLHHIALFNNALLSINGQSRALQIVLVDAVFSQDMKLKIQNTIFATSEYENIVVFHRQQQLLLFKFALISCLEQGGESWSETNNHVFGEACLMTSDLTGDRDLGDKHDRSMLEIASEAIQLSDLSVDQNLNSVGRAYEVWLTISNDNSLTNRPDYVDFTAKFAQYYGFTVDDFITVLYLIFIQTEQFNTQDNNSFSHLIIDLEKLVKINFDLTVFQKILSVAESGIGSFGSSLHMRGSSCIELGGFE